MSKTTENVILVPGESGWEIWTGQSGSKLTLREATTIDRASDLTTIPNGELLLLFPVKSVTAVPMRVASDDEALFPDLAALHAERLGLRPDPMAGQLTDTFVIAREAENSALVSIMLRAPGDGDMPPRGPKGFDISARAYALSGDALAIWKEFGRWVFSLSHQGNLVYCQATSVSSPNPNDALAREVRLALMQLSMQGLEIEPSRILVWSASGDVETSALSAAFTAPIDVSARPAPIVPVALSKLLPADVHAARRSAKKRQNVILGIAAVALVYLGVIGWFGYGVWKDNTQAKELSKLAEDMAPDAAAFTTHTEKWDQLADAIELSNSPVDILSRIAACIPPNSGLRLKTADITAHEIKIIGEAPQLPAVNTFSLNLDKNNDLARFDWQIPEPNQSTRGWEFNFSGQIPNP